MNNNQIAVINTEFTKNDQKISVGTLAIILGKQKGHVVRKMEREFSPESLSQMENHCLVSNGGRGGVAVREVKDYLLPRKEAVALAMMYDINIGMALLDALETLAKALEDITEAETLGDAKTIAKTALSDPKSYLGCSYLSSDEKHTALKRLR